MVNHCCPCCVAQLVTGNERQRPKNWWLAGVAGVLQSFFNNTAFSGQLFDDVADNGGRSRSRQSGTHGEVKEYARHRGAASPTQDTGVRAADGDFRVYGFKLG